MSYIRYEVVTSCSVAGSNMSLDLIRNAEWGDVILKREIACEINSLE